MTSRNTIGREPLTIVEIDQLTCTLTYGVAPCEAELGVTGDSKCFNTFRSCQDPDNFTSGLLTLRFGVAMEDNGLNKIVNVIPSLVSVDTVPTEINIGGSSQDSGALGRRASITATFKDHPYHDRLVDKYTADRDYDPMAQGTFWGKWLARNPYHQGYNLRVREGYVGQSLGEMTVRHYIVERIDGPDQGLVKIVANDPLKLLDNTRATVPRPSRGVLTAAITELDTTLVLVASGVGASYPSSGIGRIGGELVSYTRTSDSITLTARGLRGTIAEVHQSGDTFQDVYVVDALSVDLVLQQLMEDYAEIPASFINETQWQTEAMRWLSGFDLQAWITEPTGVAAAVTEIVQQCSCFVWWDEREQTIPFRAIRPYFDLFDDPPLAVTEYANIVADSVSIDPKPDERISQVVVYYHQINPTGAVDDPANYARMRSLIDQDAEEPLQYGSKRIKTIFARWLGEAGDSASLVLATRILERSRDTPRVITFSTDAKDDDIRTGRVVTFTHHDLVDFDGAAEPTMLQIVSSREAEQGHRIEFSGRPILSRDNYAFITENDAPDYDDTTADERVVGSWIAPSATGFDNGDPPYRML